MNHSSPAPRDVKALRQEGVLEITWSDEHVSRYVFVVLRGQCECAGCVDERTGIRTLDLASISPTITIDELQLVGNYALRIRWSDGHATGLYPWSRLRKLCPCPACADASSR